MLSLLMFVVLRVVSINISSRELPRDAPARVTRIHAAVEILRRDRAQIDRVSRAEELGRGELRRVWHGPQLHVVALADDDIVELLLNYGLLQFLLLCRLLLF